MKYFHRHPRNFVNECYVVRIASRTDEAFALRLGYERITRVDLRAHIAHVNAENSAWGSGRAFGVIRFADVIDPANCEYAAWFEAIAW